MDQSKRMTPNNLESVLNELSDIESDIKLPKPYMDEEGNITIDKGEEKYVHVLYVESKPVSRSKFVHSFKVQKFCPSAWAKNKERYETVKGTSDMLILHTGKL